MNQKSAEAKILHIAECPTQSHHCNCAVVHECPIMVHPDPRVQALLADLSHAIARYDEETGSFSKLALHSDRAGGGSFHSLTVNTAAATEADLKLATGSVERLTAELADAVGRKEAFKHRLECSRRMQDYLIAGEREALKYGEQWAANVGVALSAAIDSEVSLEQRAEAAETALAAANEKLAELTAIARLGWRVGSDPRRNGRFVCGDTHLTWPDCIKGEGATEDEAIAAALATRTNSSVLDGLRDSPGAEGKGTADAE